MTVNSLSLHFLQEHPRDAARTLEQFEPAELARYLELVPTIIAAEVLKFMIPSIAAECLKNMALNKSSPLIMQLGIERGSILLRRMRETMREQIISSTSPFFSNMARLVLRYPEGTVGQAMNPNVFSVHQDMSVSEVITAVRNSADLNCNQIFITGDQQEIRGVVEVRLLLVSDGKLSMKEIMHSPGNSVSARSSLASVYQSIAQEPREIFPVVDHHGAFIGILTRSALHEHLSGNVATGQDDKYAGAALAMAELFWETCADLLGPPHNQSNKGNENE